MADRGDADGDGQRDTAGGDDGDAVDGPGAVPGAAAVRARLLDVHRPTLDRALSCADAVVAGWDGEATTDRERVVEPYRATLRRAGLLERLVQALADAVSTAGYELSARPVPDVPYLAVTSRGVVLRGTTEAGRVVVTLRAFEIDAGGNFDDTAYRRGPSLPAALDVEVR